VFELICRDKSIDIGLVWMLLTGAFIGLVGFSREQGVVIGVRGLG